MSTISASTTSTTGFKVTSDTTGTLVLQTGASPTTAMTIDGSQNVTFARGISSGLNVSGAGWGVLPYISNSLVVDNNSGQARFFATGDASNFGSYIWYGGKTGGSTSTYMALDTSGNLGVGTTSTSGAKLAVVGSSTSGYMSVGDGTATMLMGTGAALSSDSSIPYLRSNGSIGIAAGGGTERARFTTTGQLLIGKTTGNTYLNVTTSFDYLTTTFTSGAGNYGYLALPQTPSTTLMLVDLTNANNGNLNVSALLLVNTRNLNFGGGNGITTIAATQGSTGTGGEISTYSFAISGSGTSLSLRATATLVSGSATINFSARIIQI